MTRQPRNPRYGLEFTRVPSPSDSGGCHLADAWTLATPTARISEGCVETDKGDVPIRKEYFQLWYMQGTPYALYDNYAYVTL